MHDSIATHTSVGGAVDEYTAFFECVHAAFSVHMRHNNSRQGEQYNDDEIVDECPTHDR